MLLDKLRTALRGNAGPMLVRLQILGGVEFAAKGYLEPLKPEDVGYPTSDFCTGAMKSVTNDCKTYGIPTNNKTMAFIWNAKIFKDAGLDPENPPATRDDAAAESRIIPDKLGIAGYGLMAKQNAGSTPFRFMPQMWAFGGGAQDEETDSPTCKVTGLNSPEDKAALQASYDMYLRDKPVPVSALTNTQADNQAPFIAGQLAMMIAHPAEDAKMLDLTAKATGADKEVADAAVATMRYGLIPKGQALRAEVFGGSNIQMIKNEYVDAGLDEAAAKALVCFWTSQEWSTKLARTGSNPGSLQGFRTEWMKQRLDTIKFLDVTTSMLPKGIPFPVVPEAREIMYIIIPDMLQNALTGKLTVDEAAEDAAKNGQGPDGRHVGQRPHARRRRPTPPVPARSGRQFSNGSGVRGRLSSQTGGFAAAGGRSSGRVSVWAFGPVGHADGDRLSDLLFDRPQLLPDPRQPSNEGQGV